VKVALLNPVFWPEVRRGSERVARDLADGLIARGDRVRLITSRAGRPGVAVEDGLEVQRVWRPPGGGRLERRLYEQHLTHVPLSYAALRRFDPDVAHPFFATDALAATRWGRERGRPVVFSFMGVPHRQGLANRRWRKELLVRACAEADAVVALSQEAADAFGYWLGVEARAIAPGVDLDAFSPAPGERAAAPTILCAADPAEPRKRVGLLLDAFARVRARHPDARLVLSRRGGASGPAGPGVEWRDLDGPGALAAANREAWVHALPSFGEAFGLVLAEALACGTTVVGPTRELVDGVGEHFAGDEPEPLAATLERALDRARDPATPAACRARAERFSRRATTDAYAALYGELGA
jgi:glycosyltransferase involved in cell wall biosynthesis